MKKKYLTLKQAFSWIFYSMVITFAVGGSAFLIYGQILKYRMKDDAYHISVILQTGPKKEALTTAYLAEVMDIADDEKTNLYQFNTVRAKRQLLSSPLIKSAKVKKIFPSTVFVDYTARMPMALLYDYPNVAIDDEGYIFPLSPFFTPKKLPEIYIGLMPFGYEDDEYGSRGATWNKPIEGQEVKLAFSIINSFSKQSELQLLRVDVSNAFSDSWGRREVVLVINDTSFQSVDDKLITVLFPRILRLSTQNHEIELEKYRLIRKHLIDEALAKLDLNGLKNVVKAPGLIVDLRIQDLAYVR